MLHKADDDDDVERDCLFLSFFFWITQPSDCRLPKADTKGTKSTKKKKVRAENGAESDDDDDDDDDENDHTLRT